MHRSHYLFATLFTVGISYATFSEAQDENIVRLRVAGWNMESSESSDTLLRSQIGQKQEVDLWGFVEVRDSDALHEFEIGAEIGETANYESILGESGGSDRIGIVYNAERLILLESGEIRPSNPNLFARHRNPLMAKFRGATTGQEFNFIVNHLARRDDELRVAQARFLNQWIVSQTAPTIAVGDYNFDYHVSFGDGGDRDPGFDEMVKDNHWIWLKPKLLTKTQASDNFNTVLDFVFVANPLPNWTAISTILARDGDEPAPEGDFDDDDDQTDHLPVDAVFAAMTSNRVADLRDDEAPMSEDATAALNARIDQLEAEIAKLRSEISDQ